MRFLILTAFVLGSCGGSGGADFVIDSEIFDGSYSISGTITLPAAVSDKGATLNVARVSAGGGSELVSQRASGSSLTYRISNLPAGSYTVQMRIDVDGNGTFNEAGDYEGYCCGTLAAPITDSAEATEITLTNANLTNQNFGLQ